MFAFHFVKFVCFNLLLLIFFITTIPLYPFYLVFPETIRKIVSYIIQFIAKNMLSLLGARVAINKKIYSNKGRLVISNHLSYLDMLILLSQYRTSFITSKEIKETPFLGQICELAGCYYTDRKDKKNIHQEVKDIKIAIQKGETITFFPEATSTNAEEIKRFRKPFFYPAQELKIPVTTITLNYRFINDMPFSKKNRDLVCWYGDMTFFAHYWNLMKITRLEVDLKVHEVGVQEDIEQTVLSCEQLIRNNFIALT